MSEEKKQRPLFIALEGIDGCGKSTAIMFLRKKLEDLLDGRLIVARDPGSTVLSDKIREILLEISDSSGEEIDPIARLMLFQASRLQLLKHIIKPAIRRGDSVLCDMYVESTFAYQHSGEGIEFRTVHEITLMHGNVIIPNHTILLDIDPNLFPDRLSEKEKDFFDKKGMDYFKRVREGYLKRAQYNRHNIYVVNANKSVDDVKDQLDCIIDRIFRNKV